MPFAGTDKIDPLISPLVQKQAAGGVIEVLVDNSSVQGIVAIGGWAFPIDAVAVRGHMRVGVRDAAGDRIVFDDNIVGEPPLDPPDYVKYITNVSGDSTDAGNASYRVPGRPTTCINIANGARWVTNAGIARTVEFTFTEDYQTASGPDTCPGLGTVFAPSYTVRAIFSG